MRFIQSNSFIFFKIDSSSFATDIILFKKNFSFFTISYALFLLSWVSPTLDLALLSALVLALTFINNLF